METVEWSAFNEDVPLDSPSRLRDEYLLSSGFMAASYEGGSWARL